MTKTIKKRKRKSTPRPILRACRNVFERPVISIRNVLDIVKIRVMLIKNDG